MRGQPISPPSLPEDEAGLQLAPCAAAYINAFPSSAVDVAVYPNLLILRRVGDAAVGHRD